MQIQQRAAAMPRRDAAPLACWGNGGPRQPLHGHSVCRGRAWERARRRPEAHPPHYTERKLYLSVERIVAPNTKRGITRMPTIRPKRCSTQVRQPRIKTGRETCTVPDLSLRQTEPQPPPPAVTAAHLMAGPVWRIHKRSTAHQRYSRRRPSRAYLSHRDNCDDLLWESGLEPRH